MSLSNAICRTQDEHDAFATAEADEHPVRRRRRHHRRRRFSRPRLPDLPTNLRRHKDMSLYCHRHMCIKASATAGSSAMLMNSCFKKKSPVVLRPTDVPYAPENSTQFIIDDHGSSDLVWTLPSSLSSSSCASSSSSTGSTSVTRLPSQVAAAADSETEDSFAREYLERDFQSVYETEHQEQVAQWSKQRLILEICGLERRHRHLVKRIHEDEEEALLRAMRRSLRRLQAKNRRLFTKACPLYKVSSASA